MAVRSSLLTPAEAAALARLSVKTVYRAIWSGELPATRVRGRWRIVQESLWRWLGIEDAA
jgi:excisionase family DNA binding protein